MVSLKTRPVRALMATEFSPGATGNGLAEALRRIGWDVAEVNHRDYALVGKSLAERIGARAMHRLLSASYNAQILALAEQVNAQVMVAVKGSFITSETLAKLRAAGVRCVNYYPDFHFDHPGITPAALAQYDLIATTKRFQVDYLTAAHGAERTAFVQHAYNADVHRRHYSGDIPYRWDISMIGNPSPQKAQYMIAVAQAFPDCRIAVIGNGWAKYAAGTALAPYVVGHPLIGDFFARAIEESRINIAVHMGPRTPGGWEDAVSTRTFEIPAAGGFMLHIDNEEVRTLYEPGREIDVFTTPESLCERIGYYLDNEDRRLEIARAGTARCTPAYSLDARATALAACLAERGIVAPEHWGEVPVPPGSCSGSGAHTVDGGKLPC